MSDALLRKIDALEAENAELRDRLERIERVFLGADIVFPPEWDLRCTEQRILAALLMRPLASKDQLTAAIARDLDGEHANPAIVEPHVSRLRRKMAAYGLTIRSERHLGYAIPEPKRLDFRRRCRARGDLLPPAGDESAGGARVDAA